MSSFLFFIFVTLSRIASKNLSLKEPFGTSILLDITASLHHSLHLSNNQVTSILVPHMAQLSNTLEDLYHLSLNTPKPTEVLKVAKLRRQDLIDKFGLIQRSFVVNFKIMKVSVMKKVTIVYVDLSKFLTALFKEKEWFELYGNLGDEMVALMYWDGTPMRNFARDKTYNGQVSGMLQFITFNSRLQRSVKSVIVFCSYDGNESIEFIDCLTNSVLQNLDEISFYIGDRIVKVYYKRSNCNIRCIYIIIFNVSLFYKKIINFIVNIIRYLRYVHAYKGISVQRYLRKLPFSDNSNRKRSSRRCTVAPRLNFSSERTRKCRKRKEERKLRPYRKKKFLPSRPN